VGYSNTGINVQDIPNLGIPSKDQVWDKSFGLGTSILGSKYGRGNRGARKHAKGC